MTHNVDTEDDDNIRLCNNNNDYYGYVRPNDENCKSIIYLHIIRSLLLLSLTEPVHIIYLFHYHSMIMSTKSMKTCTIMNI